MGVLVANRRESKLEPIIFADEIHSMLREFMQRNFGVRDLDQLVRVRFAYGRDETEDFWRYRYLMHTHKQEIDRLSTLLTNDLCASKNIYPTNIAEYQMKRDFQNSAIVRCHQILKELQKIADTFDVDLNVYGRYVKSLNREIELIKTWRQRENKIKSALIQKQGSIC